MFGGARASQQRDAMLGGAVDDFDDYGMPSAPPVPPSASASSRFLGKFRRRSSTTRSTVSGIPDDDDDDEGGSAPTPSGAPQLGMAEISMLRDRQRYPAVGPSSDASGSRAMSLTSMSNFDTTPIIPTLGTSSGTMVGAKRNTTQDKYRQKMIDSRRALLSSEIGSVPSLGTVGPSVPQGNGPYPSISPNGSAENRAMSMTMPPRMPMHASTPSLPGVGGLSAPPGPPGPQWRGQPALGSPYGRPSTPGAGPGVPYGAGGYGAPGPQGYFGGGHSRAASGRYSSGSHSPGSYGPGNSYGPGYGAPGPYQQYQVPQTPTGPHNPSGLAHGPYPPPSGLHAANGPNGGAQLRPNGRPPYQTKADVITPQKGAPDEFDFESPPEQTQAQAVDPISAESAQRIQELEEEVRVLSIELAEAARRELNLDPAHHAQADTAAALARAHNELALERRRRQVLGTGPNASSSDIAALEHRHAEATHLLDLRTDQFNQLQKQMHQMTVDLEAAEAEASTLRRRNRELEAAVEARQVAEPASHIQVLEQENARLRAQLDEVSDKGPLGERVRSLEEQRSVLQETLRTMRSRKDAEISALRDRLASQDPSTATSLVPGTLPHSRSASGNSANSLPSRQYSHALADNSGDYSDFSFDTTAESKPLSLPRLHTDELQQRRPSSPLHLTFDIPRQVVPGSS